MKIIFMGTPDFAVPAFKKLLESKHQLVALYTQKPKAKGRGMEVKKATIQRLAEVYRVDVYTPDSLKSEEEIEKFRNIKADIAVVAAYGMLLPEDVLTGPKKGCINIHPSILPRWRGAAPLQRTIMAGDTRTGVCIMKMNEGLDTGDVILKEEFNIPENADTGWLHDYAAEKGAEMMLRTLDLIETGKATYTEQTENGVTYAKKITKADQLIDVNKTGEEIINQIRGLSPFPGAYFMHNGIKYKVFEGEFVPYSQMETVEDKDPNAPRQKYNDKFFIKCADGKIIPKQIQKEGKNRMSIEEFLNGNKAFIGAIIS